MHRRWAYLLFAVAVVEAVIAVGGALVVGLGGRDALGSYLVTNVAIGAAFAPCGLLVARQRPGNPVGRLMLAAAVAPLISAAMVPIAAYGSAHGWPEAALRLVITVFLLAWPWGVGLCLPLILQLFPTGAPVSPRWRALLAATVAVGVASAVVMGTGPTPDLAADTYLLLGDPGPVVSTLVEVLLVVVLLASVASLFARYRTGGDTVRRQLLWLLLAAVVAVGINVPGAVDVTHRSTGDIALLLTIALIPVAITVAILRHGLFDIRLVVSRAVLYLVLSGCVAGAYAGLVALLGLALRGAGVPVIATLLIALVFNAARVRLQRVVDRAFYGARADPVRAVTAVGQRLAGDDLGGVVDGVREALRVPYAALHSPTGPIAAGGQPPGTLHTMALTYRGTRVGDLVVGVRRGESRLSAADRAVLDLLATPLAVAVHAVGLSEQVQASRERLVGAAEEERRRLHRELHDSLGPALTGAAFKAQAVANYAPADPAHATRLATELGDDLRSLIGDVRRLVYGLRPPALDELGLVGAVRGFARQFPDLEVRVDGPEPMPPLPAAVEVAAYRIATEAVANVVRHAGARRARVCLTPDGAQLRVSVTDDGGPAATWQPGVGLRSITERAAELGGHAAAGPTPDGGRVDAVLPLAVAG